MATDNKPKFTIPLADIQKDVATVTGLIQKYSDQAAVLPPVIGSALGGLRTALRGLVGHVDNAAAVPAAPTAPDAAKN